jgi:hypothetical protein
LPVVWAKGAVNFGVDLLVVLLVAVHMVSSFGRVWSHLQRILALDVLIGSSIGLVVLLQSLSDCPLPHPVLLWPQMRPSVSSVPVLATLCLLPGAKEESCLTTGLASFCLQFHNLWLDVVVLVTMHSLCVIVLSIISELLVQGSWVRICDGFPGNTCGGDLNILATAVIRLLPMRKAGTQWP